MKTRWIGQTSTRRVQSIWRHYAFTCSATSCTFSSIWTKEANLKTLFEGQAIKCEMVVLMMEKWGLHPQMEEKQVKPDLDDLARDARVLIPEDEYEKAYDILFGESE